MNISIFTNDDTRENVLKHVRGGKGLCYEPPLQSVTPRTGNSYSSGSLSRANTSGLIGTNPSRQDSTKFSPLFCSDSSDGSLKVSPIHTYRSECFAEDLLEDLE